MSARRIRRAVGAALASAAVLVPATAAADNRRVAIADYRWSDEAIELDLGEHVTWYWTGPDTMHSVTGDSPAAAGLDSDPQTNQPQHRVGDSFRIDFNDPGYYRFRCKLHSGVSGEVVVSSTPGDPDSEPDPVPKSNIDLVAPELRELRLAKETFGRRGTALRFGIDSRSRLEADYFLIGRDGRRRFAGWSRWKTSIGYGNVRFGTRSNNFRPRPGRYVAEVRAYDEVENESRPQRLSFRIRKPRR
jgi:plastocyanin